MSGTDHKEKLLFLVDSMAGGGAEKVLSTLLRHLDRNRFDVTLCPVCDTGIYREAVRPYVSYRPILPDPARLNRIRGFVYKVSYKLIYKILPPKWVYRCFVPKGADVEIAFSEGFPTKLISASSSKDSRKLAWVHIDLEAHPWTQARGVYKDLTEEIRCYSHFDAIAAVSASVRDAFERRYGKSVPVSILYNPVDPEEIRRKGQDTAPQGWSERQQTFRIVSAGRLAPQKGYDRLLRGCGMLCKEGYDLEVRIAGEGPQRKELEEMITMLGLTGKVRLPGFLPNPYALIAGADLFVAPSRSEGYSTAVTEALILGVPVLVTDCSGMRELIGEKGCGLVTGNDESAFTAGLRGILNDKDVYDSLKAKAAVFKDSFSLETLMETAESFLGNDYAK